MIDRNYDKAKKQGDRVYRQALAEGRYPYLPALDDLVPDIETLQKKNVGNMEIPLSMIAGTKSAGRQNAFTLGFLPIMGIHTEFAMKWERLCDSQMEEGIREPIRVVEYLRNFYVVEGNKRVSIMNYVGMRTASAEVVRILPEKTDEEEIRIYYEFLDFFKAAPIYELYFTKAGSYRHFAELYGKDLSEKWGTEDVRRIRSALIYFTELFMKKGGGGLRITPSDALLIYMNFYPLSSVIDESTDIVSKRLDRLWNEFVTDMNRVDLVESPDDVRKGAGSLSLFNLLRGKEYTKEHPLTAAFMYEKNPERSSWLYGHLLGQNHVDESMDGLVKTLRYNDLGTESALRSAIDDAVEKGAKIIFTTTSRQMDETLRCAVHFPKVRFLNCSVLRTSGSVRTYYARMYEAKFVMGAVAASLSDNHKLGYLADMPIYGTIANINAFAEGAAMVDPKVEVYLKWYMKKEGNWREELLADDVRMISGKDLIRLEKATREYGLYRILPDGGISNIAVPVTDWGRYYELILKHVLEGDWDQGEAAKNGQTVNYFWGMSAGVVDLILSGHLTYHTQKFANLLKEDIIHGGQPVFRGELLTNTRERFFSGEDMPDAEKILTMNRLADRVIGEIPGKDELMPDAIETMDVIGLSAC